MTGRDIMTVIAFLVKVGLNRSRHQSPTLSTRFFRLTFSVDPPSDFTRSLECDLCTLNKLDLAVSVWTLIQLAMLFYFSC